MGEYKGIDAYEFPKLEYVDKNGRVIHWQIIVHLINASGKTIPITKTMKENGPINADIHAAISILSQIGQGKIRDIKDTYVRSGKNIGKINETNVLIQAIKDANAKYTVKLRKTSSEIPLPMLVSKYKEDSIRGEIIYVQRKYNGIRCLVKKGPSGIVLYTRTGTELKADRFNDIVTEYSYIFNDLKNNGNDNIYIDGELFKEGMHLQDIMGSVLAKETAESSVLHYVFDIFDPSRPNLIFSERLKILKEIQGISLRSRIKKVQVIETYGPVKTDNEILGYYKTFINEGYEGLIARMDKPYEPSNGGHRSHFVMKLKETNDSEFEIVGYSLGQNGSHSDAILFICKTANGETFTVTPKWSLKKRKAMTDKEFNENYKGKLLIVYFDELSTSGIPLRARTKGEIRSVINGKII